MGNAGQADQLARTFFDASNLHYAKAQGIQSKEVATWDELDVNAQRELREVFAELIDGGVLHAGRRRPPFRDRNENYVPDGLSEEKRRKLVEISPPAQWWTPEQAMEALGNAEELITALANVSQQVDVEREETLPVLLALALQWRQRYADAAERTFPPRLAPAAYALADELNREHHGHWWWVDTSGDGTHWSHFRGHHAQVDVRFSTFNEQEVNSWKGRDEIRPSGEWHVLINRQPMASGYVGDDPLGALERVREVVRKLLNHDALDHSDPRSYAEQLLGRRVYYDRTPAVVSYVSTLHQGCVGLKPVGMPEFPPAAHDMDQTQSWGDEEADEIKVDIIQDGRIWWWRSKAYGDEPAPLPKGASNEAGGQEGEAGGDQVDPGGDREGSDNENHGGDQPQDDLQGHDKS